MTDSELAQALQDFEQDFRYLEALIVQAHKAAK